MSEDIVTRLRDVAWVSPDASDATIADKVVHEAADEIERLRADRDQFRKFWSYAIHERDELFDTAFPTNKNYTSFIHPDAKGDS